MYAGIKSFIAGRGFILTKKLFKNGANLSDAYSVRTEVFIREQGFCEELEFDDTDLTAVHIVFYDGDKPVATGRVFPSQENPDEFILGRIAALKQYRGTGLGRELMDALEAVAADAGARSLKLGAQCGARGFYERCGYLAFGEVYMDEHCPHIYMRKALSF